MDFDLLHASVNVIRETGRSPVRTQPVCGKGLKVSAGRGVANGSGV
jgi:hypothetical protein